MLGKNRLWQTAKEIISVNGKRKQSTVFAYIFNIFYDSISLFHFEPNR